MWRSNQKNLCGGGARRISTKQQFGEKGEESWSYVETAERAQASWSCVETQLELLGDGVEYYQKEFWYYILVSSNISGDSIYIQQRK